MPETLKLMPMEECEIDMKIHLVLPANVCGIIELRPGALDAKAKIRLRGNLMGKVF
jgi:hypothetical protein